MNVAKADPGLRKIPQFRWGGKSMLEDRGESSLNGIGTGPPWVENAGGTSYRGSWQRPVVDMCPTVTDAGWLAKAESRRLYTVPGTGPAHAVDKHFRKDFIDYTK